MILLHIEHNMKTQILFLSLLLAGAVRVSASSDFVVPSLDLTFHHIIPSSGLPSHYPRVPSRISNVAQDGHTFTFENAGYFQKIELVDTENGEEIIYECAIEDSALQTTIPEEFQGMFEIRFYTASFYLSSIIELQ